MTVHIVDPQVSEEKNALKANLKMLASSHSVETSTANLCYI